MFNDHKNEYIFKRRNLNLKQRRWMECLEDFDPDYEYRFRDESFVPLSYRDDDFRDVRLH